MSVAIEIDGKQLQVEEGMNLLEAALQNGIYIPHLCHHPDLPDIGSCRLCIVEVEGGEGVQPSCKLTAREGMKVTTNSPRIAELRKLAMELLLAAHPEDCSTCPKYGRCELQTLIQYMGVSATRMHTRVKGFAQNDKNPLLIHDMNRCVLCGRCVRACGDLRGVGALQYLGVTTGAVALICAGLCAANGDQVSDAPRISAGFLLGDLWAVLALAMIEKLPLSADLSLFVTLFVLGGLAVLLSGLLPRWIFCPAWLCGWAIG